MKKLLFNLALILSTCIQPAYAEPLQGPMYGEFDIKSQDDLILSIDLLRGSPTEVGVLAPSDTSIICGLFEDTGEPIIMDIDEDNECGFRITAQNKDASVLLAVHNNSPESVHVKVAAR